MATNAVANARAELAAARDLLVVTRRERLTPRLVSWAAHFHEAVRMRDVEAARNARREVTRLLRVFGVPVDDW